MGVELPLHVVVTILECCVTFSGVKLSIRSFVLFIGTAGYNNKILVSDSGFSLGKNDMVNTSVPEKSSHKTFIIPKHTPMQKVAHKEVPSKHISAIIHEEKKIALVLFLTSAFGISYAFQ